MYHFRPRVQAVGRGDKPQFHFLAEMAGVRGGAGAPRGYRVAPVGNRPLRSAFPIRSPLARRSVFSASFVGVTPSRYRWSMRIRRRKNTHEQAGSAADISALRSKCRSSHRRIGGRYHGPRRSQIPARNGAAWHADKSRVRRDARTFPARADDRLLADFFFALYVKTKNFHWHMSGPHFGIYHLPARRAGLSRFSPRPDGHPPKRVAPDRRHHVALRRPDRAPQQGACSDNDADYVPRLWTLLAEVCATTNLQLAAPHGPPKTHGLCDERGDGREARACLENLDRRRPSGRVWFLFEGQAGHGEAGRS